MAHQAILAAQERRRQTAAEAGGFLAKTRRRQRNKNLTLREVLALQQDRLDSLFPLWDTNGDGEVDRREFKRAVKLMGVKVSDTEFDAFCDLFDEDKSGTLDLEELKRLLAATELPKPPPPPPPPLIVRALKTSLEVLNTTSAQTILYALVVFTFQLIIVSLRNNSEIFLDLRFSETFLDNAFDEQLNKFEDIRRVADVYAWGNQVLWPGLFLESGPSCGEVGPPHHFSSWSTLSGGGGGGVSGGFKNGCNDFGWPDGEGVMASQGGQTAWEMSEVVNAMNAFDWSEGVMIRQIRTADAIGAACRGATLIGGGGCKPQVNAPTFAEQSEAPFGYNWTAPGSLLEQPFKFFTSAAIGSNPRGESSTHKASFRTIAPGGFVSVILPFFSETYLPDERGLAADVTDYRLHRATRENGKPAHFMCVRLSWNGEIVHQLCDPNVEVGGTNVTTGVCRAAVEELWNDLKRAHYIDTSSRALVITLQISSNELGVRSRVRFMFEFTPAGGTLASYDVTSRVATTESLDDARFYAMIAFAFTSLFCFLEALEMTSGGLAEYFANMWNVMDWANFTIFYWAWLYIVRYVNQATGPIACSQLCTTVGYIDDYEAYYLLVFAKKYLSMCACIQLLKVAKFASALVPKMGLAPTVLKKALPDMVFFGAIFFISMVAFSTLFYIQLGPSIIDFSTQVGSFIALARALFGDFDIDEVLENSQDYTNLLLFVAYLFVAVFILLSMFFAILGESQAHVRDDQRESKKQATDAGSSLQDEYGIFSTMHRALIHAAAKAPIIGKHLKRSMAEAKVEEIQKAIEENGPTAIDRVEARQLEMLDGIQDLFGGVKTGLEALTDRMDEMALMGSAGGGGGGGGGGSGVGGAGSEEGGAASAGDGKGGGILKQVASMHTMIKAQQEQQEAATAAIASIAKELAALRSEAGAASLGGSGSKSRNTNGSHHHRVARVSDHSIRGSMRGRSNGGSSFGRASSPSTVFGRTKSMEENGALDSKPAFRRSKTFTSLGSTSSSSAMPGRDLVNRELSDANLLGHHSKDRPNRRRGGTSANKRSDVEQQEMLDAFDA